jgi:hypothetical protein
MTLMLFPGTRGKMIHEKNLKRKIWWHCPFNMKFIWSGNERKMVTEKSLNGKSYDTNITVIMKFSPVYIIQLIPEYSSWCLVEC